MPNVAIDPKDRPMKVCVECGVEFRPKGKGWQLRKYCDEHFVGHTSEYKPVDKRQRMICALKECRRHVSLQRANNGAKYCTLVHQRKAAKQRFDKKKKAERLAKTRMLGVGEDTTERKGDAYQALMGRRDLVALLNRGEIQVSYVAHLLGFTTGAISRAYQAVVTTMKFEELKEGWKPRWQVRAMLPAWKLQRMREIGPNGVDRDHPDYAEFHRLADELIRAYAAFSRYYFQLEGRRPLIKGFHLTWIREIIIAYAIGGKLNIQSPPRHGKSEMLVRFAVWLIVMFPNIRIMWVAANTDVAKLMLGSVKDHLANNDQLIEDVLPPGDRFQPEKSSGRPWSAKEIKVAQQTHVGQKSSTMLALGRTTKILSRDVDLLIVDDLEDFDSTREQSQRVYSRNKFAEIGTRKEERTGWVNIGSRQHPDDIYSKLMALGGIHNVEEGEEYPDGDPLAWRTLVNSAHDELKCGLDPEVIDGHDLNGCVLFPEVRSYRWLIEKKHEMEALGIPGAYEMRYLNAPVATTGMVFDVKLIRDKCLDRRRGIGTEIAPDPKDPTSVPSQLPMGRLVAGLDPSARGVQAAFLWHYRDDKLSMIDLEAQKAGGFEGAHEIMEKWHLSYGLTDWFYEDNSQQIEFFNDPRTKELALRYGLNIRHHTTGKNKQDPELGISSMAPWYHNGRISLPYGTGEARQKTNMLLRQLELWTTDGVQSKKYLTDIKMASWFPFPTIIKWGNRNRDVSLKVSPGAAYPGYGRNEQSPWGYTAYPGG